MLNFNMSLVYNIINLIVLCFLLKKFLIKPVTSVMEKRKTMIEQGLINARNSEKEAEELKKQYEAVLSNAHSESRQIVDAAKKRAKEESERILKETDSQTAELIKKAEKNIEAERDKALAGIQAHIAEVALFAARKVTAGYGHAEEDLSLYDHFIENAGGVYDRKRE